jgi:hypothetical protein
VILAKDGEGALSFQPLLGDELLIVQGSDGGQVADPMIEAAVQFVLKVTISMFNYFNYLGTR